jgi:hypothetical protein
MNIGYCQSFSLDETGETKQLYGQNQYPLAAARGTIKATGKAVAAEVSGIALNSVFHGDSFATGMIIPNWATAHPIPGSGPYTITITPPGPLTFDQDLGVVYATTGLPFQRVSSLTAVGQYTNTGGLYTFFSGDAAAAVLISYTTAGGTSGQTLTITNKLIGTAPIFQIDYATTLEGNAYYLRIFQCVANKLSQSFKITDFMLPEIDFDIFANTSGNVYTASYPNVS